jgi:syntaxin 5
LSALLLLGIAAADWCLLLLAPGQDIQALNMQLTQLQHLCDTANNHQQQEHTSTVVDQLRSRLKSTTQDFKDVLTTRTENLKACDERRRLFCNQAEEAEFLHTAPLLHHTGTGSRIAGANRCNNSSEMQPPPHQQQQQQQPLLPGYNSRGGSSKPSAAELFGGSSGVRRRRHDEEHSHGPPRNHNMGSSSSSNSSSAEAAAAAAAGGVWQQQQQQQYMPHSQTATSSRVAALSNVEATIVELGSIFTQLADLVAAQGDMTQRIDENIGETLANVDSAKQQLMKYLNSISSNRWLMLKVFSVLVVFLVVFILFVA